MLYSQLIHVKFGFMIGCKGEWFSIAGIGGEGILCEFRRSLRIITIITFIKAFKAEQAVGRAGLLLLYLIDIPKWGFQ